MAESALVEHVFHYDFESTLETHNGPRLTLAVTSPPVAERPFFAGDLLRPELAAKLLFAMSEVALKRYYVPPNMLAAILRAADPVVTAGNRRLRFEAFSQCCGVYARTDLLPDMLRADAFGAGTTNVDFNPPMRAALSRVRDADGLSLEVTPRQVAMESARGSAVERKVKLPPRWIKGFAEVQALAADLTLAITLSGPDARRFLAGLPAQVRPQDRAWLYPATFGGLRISQKQGEDGVAVSGLGRLAAMKPIARYATALRIYGSRHGTSGFELDFGEARFMLMLSPSASRGFSGEGKLLAALGSKGAAQALARVRAELSWREDLKAETLADRLQLPLMAVSSALALLAAEGLVGFDPREQTYFHRVLPFDQSRILDRQPRLVAAQALHQAGAVTLTGPGNGRIDATVDSEDVVHRVRLCDGDFHCTCTWHAKTGGEQGPCKHVLATMLAADQIG